MFLVLLGGLGLLEFLYQFLYLGLEALDAFALGAIFLFKSLDFGATFLFKSLDVGAAFLFQSLDVG